jgi:transcriptional regulator with XRE-family HTH domain
MSQKTGGGKMIYEKHLDLIELKKKAGLTNRELAAVLGCSPGTVSGKLCGFVVLSYTERRKVETACNEKIAEYETTA